MSTVVNKRLLLYNAAQTQLRKYEDTLPSPYPSPSLMFGGGEGVKIALKLRPYLMEGPLGIEVI